MDELDAAGVAQFYFRESMDTSTPHGRAMLEMAAVFARLEREMIRARVVAGLARARANGQRLGRPRVPAKVEQAILAARAKTPKIGIIKRAKQFGVGVSVVQRVLTA
jgi:DNA invertase Pin-like site-specific DNA recombinase